MQGRWLSCQIRIKNDCACWQESNDKAEGLQVEEPGFNREPQIKDADPPAEDDLKIPY